MKKESSDVLVKKKTTEDKDRIKLSGTMQQKLDAIGQDEEKIPSIYELDVIRKYFYHDYDLKLEKISFINRTGNYSCKADKKILPWYILMPNGQFRLIWNLVLLFANIYLLVIAPVDFAFNLECVFSDYGEGLHYIYIIAAVLQILDLILNCFTAQLDERMEYVFDLAQIIPMYIKGDFIWDLVNTIPWYAIEKFKITDCFSDGVADSKRWYLLYFLCFFKLGKGLKILEDLFSKFSLYFKMAKLLIILLYTTHCIGIIFCGVSPSIYKSFLKGCADVECVKDYYRYNFLNLYLFSWYIGMIFFSGNDVAIERNWEMYYLLIVNVVSMIIAATLFGYITEMVVELGSSGLSPILQQKLDVMNEYMRFKEFEDGFFIVIEEYLNNLWLKQRNIIYESTFFDDLSYSLHKLLLIEQWEFNYFKASKLVKLTSIDFFTSMIPMLKPKIFMAKDIIVAEGDISSDVFFNSRNGFCSLQIGGNLVKFLGPWEYFGEIAIFLRMKRRTATITCLKDSDFLMIESGEFEKLLMDFPEDATLIGKKAKEDLMSSMKLYPSSLFAKLVPRNAKKDYLTRKSLYLDEAGEERIYFATKTDAKVNLNHYKSSMDQIEGMIFDMKTRLSSRKNELEVIHNKKEALKKKEKERENRHLI